MLFIQLIKENNEKTKWCGEREREREKERERERERDSLQAEEVLKAFLFSRCH